MSPCIAAATRAASRRLTQLYDEVLAPSGLRVTQYHLLCEIDRRGARLSTVGELATLLAMDRSALGQTLRPLEREGLIELRRDERDGRRRPIALTTAGKLAVATARPYWMRAHSLLESYFGATALSRLRATLRGIAEDPNLSHAFATDGAGVDQGGVDEHS